MSYNFTIYSAFFFATTFVSFFVALLAWQRRSIKGARELTWLMIGAGIWSFWIIFETAAPTLQEKIFFSKLEYLGAVFTPVLYLIFVLRFTGKDKFITVRHILSLLIIPLITLVFAFTNEMHNLIWSGFSAISVETNIMEYYHGIWFWIGYMIYNYLLLMLATINLMSFIIKHTKTFRFQGWIIFIGSIFPLAASVIYKTGINPVPGLDITPVSIILSGILLVYAILYMRLLDLAPVARETLVEILSDGILALDGQNRIQDINNAALSFLGIRSKNIIGIPVESSDASMTQLLKAAISKDSVEQIEIRSGEKIKTFRIIKQPIKHQQDSRLVLIRDISGEIARQKEIIAGEERFRNMNTMFHLMADNMSDMLWAKDLDKKFIFVNKAVCDNLIQATDTEEPIGKTDMFFAERERRNHPERSDWFTFGELCQDSDQVVINSQKEEHFDEFGNVRGKFLYLDVRKAPIFNDNGEMIGVVGSARDVTLQKKSESDIFKKDILLDAIAKATALLVQGENLGESINRALEIIGIATNVNRVYIFRNHYDPAYKMPLMSQDYEWTDGSVEQQIDNPDLQNVPYEIACPRWCETLSVGNVIMGNIREFPEPEKSALSAQGIKSILATPVFIDKNFWGFIGFDDCHTERAWTQTEERLLSAAANTIGAAYLRKKNEDELIRAKEKAEESDRLKSAFLANMSHEIRTPLNGILGFMSLLEEPDLTGEEKDEFIRIVKVSSDRLLNTFHDIIDLSAIESEEVLLSLADVNINQLGSILHSFFKQEAEIKGLQLFFPGGIPEKIVTIKTDKEKLKSILTHLIKNALKYTNRGFVEFGYRFKEDFIEFFVKDTGIGIPEIKRQAIFERFIQADISNSRLYEGAGLGLSIAKAYVELLGGKIWVESVEGNGTTFYFTIPYISKNVETETIQKNIDLEKILDAHIKNLKILIVEDDKTSDLILTKVLSTITPDILHANSGDEAIDVCRNNPDIDLILMDIKLPTMNGHEATRQIRQFNKDVIIIAQTAFALSGDREKAIAAGCNDYIAKPFKIYLLMGLIKKYFNE